MGRTYLFECTKCGLRAKVSGGPDRGHDFFIQTVHCPQCRRLYDVVTRSRVPAETARKLTGLRATPAAEGRLRRSLRPPFPVPSFEALSNRLRQSAGRKCVWVDWPLQCPVSADHKVTAWNSPAPCPICGVFLERSALPFRVWD